MTNRSIDSRETQIHLNLQQKVSKLTYEVI